MSPQDLNHYLEIDEILYSDWNPIGMNDLPRDEYSCYMNEIFTLKNKGSGIEAIARALYNLETGLMG